MTYGNPLTLGNVVRTLDGMRNPLLLAYRVWCAVEEDRAVNDTVDNGAA